MTLILLRSQLGPWLPVPLRVPCPGKTLARAQSQTPSQLPSQPPSSATALPGGSPAREEVCVEEDVDADVDAGPTSNVQFLTTSVLPHVVGRELHFFHALKGWALPSQVVHGKCFFLSDVQQAFGDLALSPSLSCGTR